MGQAKQRTLRVDARYRELRILFERLGVDTSVPGFYDHPAFLEQERSDPQFLALYGEWVRLRPRSATEDDRTREIIKKLSEMVLAWVEATGRTGLCVDTTNLMTRTLDRLGVWNYGVVGGFNVGLKSAPQRGRQYLWTMDDLGRGATQLGHAWVAAPPFDVVDVTIKAQGWPSDFATAMPHFLLAESCRRTTMRVTDIVSPEHRQMWAMRLGREDAELHFRLEPSLKEIERRFPGIEATTEAIVARYLPTGIRASDTPLIAMYQGDGRRFWNEVVAPSFELPPC